MEWKRSVLVYTGQWCAAAVVSLDCVRCRAPPQGAPRFRYKKGNNVHVVHVFRVIQQKEYELNEIGPDQMELDRKGVVACVPVESQAVTIDRPFNGIQASEIVYCNKQRQATRDGSGRTK